MTYINPTQSPPTSETTNQESPIIPELQAQYKETYETATNSLTEELSGSMPMNIGTLGFRSLIQPGEFASKDGHARVGEILEDGSFLITETWGSGGVPGQRTTKIENLNGTQTVTEVIYEENGVTIELTRNGENFETLTVGPMSKVLGKDASGEAFEIPWNSADTRADVEGNNVDWFLETVTESPEDVGTDAEIRTNIVLGPKGQILSGTRTAGRFDPDANKFLQVSLKPTSETGMSRLVEAQGLVNQPEWVEKQHN